LTLSEENMELRRISGLKKSDKKKCGEWYMMRAFIILRPTTSSIIMMAKYEMAHVYSENLKSRHLSVT
jgi:hypothetical protein